MRTAQTGTCTAPSSASAQSCSARRARRRAGPRFRASAASSCCLPAASSVGYADAASPSKPRCSRCSACRRPHAALASVRACRGGATSGVGVVVRGVGGWGARARRGGAYAGPNGWSGLLCPRPPDESGCVEVEGQDGVPLEQPAKHAGQARRRRDLHNQVVLDEPGASQPGRQAGWHHAAGTGPVGRPATAAAGGGRVARVDAGRARALPRP